MSKTIVMCSMPGCEEEATCKAAAPWSGGRFAELKTFGFACRDHAEAILEAARGRPEPTHLAPGESVGDIDRYPLAR